MLSLQAPADVAPTLVLAIGNPSRGDDALGPELARWLEAQRFPGVEVLVDFQCQVEHALDRAGRKLVVFVDASVTVPEAFELTRTEAHPGRPLGSHALDPGAVLHHYKAITGVAPPEAWTLAIRGSAFGLGEGLSQQARASLEGAREALRSLIIAA